MLVRLFRTTAFRLAVLYLVVFSLLAAIAFLYVGAVTREVVNQEIDQEITEEIATLRRLVPDRNLARLAYLVEARSWRPGASLYLITNSYGEPLAGNVGWVQEATLEPDGSQAAVVSYTQVNPTGGVATERSARVRLYALGQGFTLLIGRDIGERDALQRALDDALKLIVFGLLLLAVISWFILGRAVLRRVDEVAATSKAIADGDLSRRLPVGKSGDEFDRLAESLNRILDRLLALGTSLEEVSANIGHDLRTPLMRMRHRLEKIKTGVENDVATSRDDVEALIDESDQLIRLFDSLLMIARMQAGSSQISLEPIDLKVLLSDVIELYEPLITDHGFDLNLALDTEVNLHANRELLAQLLSNLIDNVLKYGCPTEGDRKPVLTLTLSAEKENALITVCDNGPGIAEADKKRVFDRFVRLEESRGTKPGTGLGLSLVWAIVAVHNGRIELQNADPGLRIVISLPLLR